MGKKNLDKLFQEKFTDFSAVPDKKVWERIEASLDKKKKTRTVIPIWWKLGGVAAMLAMLLYAINPFGGVSDVNQKVTDIEKIDTNSQEKITDQEDSFEIPQNENIKITNSDTFDKKDDSNNTQDVKEGTPSYTNVEKNVESQIKQTQKDKSNILNKNHAPVEEIQITDIAVKTQSKDLVEDNTSHKDSRLIPNNISEVLAVSVSETENKETKVANTDFDRNKVNIEKSVLDNSKHLKKEEGISNVKEDDKNGVEDLKKKSLFDEIKKQEEENTKVVENTVDKWSVGANVAPVYFNGFGEGSPVHSIFASNSKSGDINLSYGLSVSYVLSKKLSIRSGVNKVDYGYNTNDVEFTSSFGISGDGQIANIDYTTPAVNLVLESKIGGTRKETFAEVADLNSTRDGVMAQQFGYLEIPVELNYALVDKKFGVNLIGGISSLFLVNNSVAVTSGELTTKIGEANNLNTVNFSTNIGFGVSYKFSPKVKLNLEPVFKYQLNTFSNTAGSFQPFSAGIYSGLNFKF